MTEQINSITNLTDTNKTIDELLSEGYQGVSYELIDNEGFVATANHFADKIQWLKTSPDKDGDIGLMTFELQAFDELLDFMLDKFGWCPMVYSNKSAPEIHIFTPENELEEMAIELTTDGEYGWKGSLYRLAYVEKYQHKIGLIFATKPEDSEEQDWLLVQIDQKKKERGWSVHDGTLEQVYYIMAEKIEIPEPNYNPTPEQITEAINSQTSEKIPIHLLLEGIITDEKTMKTMKSYLTEIATSFPQIIKSFLSSNYPDCIEDVRDDNYIYLSEQKILNNWKAIKANGNENLLIFVAFKWANFIEERVRFEFKLSSKIELFSLLHLNKLTILNLVIYSNLGCAYNITGEPLEENGDHSVFVSLLTYEIVRILMVQILWAKMADLRGADLTNADLEGIITDENTKIEIPEE